VTEYVVDATHSNWFQAGASNGDLETVPALLAPDPTVRGSSLLRVALRSRSVVLLIVKR
jgi:hypothetical protein